jgi:uncharacterized repeat protein (TIGR03803 family)
MDHAGNLYGTTSDGGQANCGTVFELAPDGTETVLHAFAGGIDGCAPFGGLVRDGAGNLFGTTELSANGCSDVGCGTVFRIAADGTKTVLHTFGGNADGAEPLASLIMDDAGNLYGTTGFGGDPSCGYDAVGCGTVFKIAPDGTETVLYAFGVTKGDGTEPIGGLLRVGNGAFFGTTSEGGGTCYCGTVFTLNPDGTEKVLYSFTGGSDGAYPSANLIRDDHGNLVSTTFAGGNVADCGGNGCGTIFALRVK